MPKMDENKTLNNKIRKLAPDAIEEMGDMLRNPNTPAPTKAQLIGFILERTLGKPDTTIHLMTNGNTLKESENRLIAIAEEIREEMKDEPAHIPETDREPDEEDSEDADEPEDGETDEREDDSEE